MTSVPTYSIIVPVYNRPDEVKELLQSLSEQTVRDFEVIIVEDGSGIRAEEIVREYASQFPVRYFYNENEGPGPARNFGFRHAAGRYFVVFDSDCIIPPVYFEHVQRALSAFQYDAWGGPDRAHEKFTVAQRAMAYTMSSFLTTGGIRGGKKRVGWFQPRSFNMGISREVFEVTKGFVLTHSAEDIDLSIRMKKAGFRIGLIEEAFVYHKRRSTFGQFFRQVKNFGQGRAHLARLHAGEVKLTHWFPSVFSLGFFASVLLLAGGSGIYSIPIGFYLLYFLAIFFHSLIVNRSVSVAFLSIPSAFLQLLGYGTGFLKERLKTYFSNPRI